MARSRFCSRSYISPAARFAFCRMSGSGLGASLTRSSAVATPARSLLLSATILPGPRRRVRNAGYRTSLPGRSARLCDTRSPPRPVGPPRSRLQQLGSEQMVPGILRREFVHVADRLVILMLAAEKQGQDDFRVDRSFRRCSWRLREDTRRALSADPLSPAMAAATFTLQGRRPIT